MKQLLFIFTILISLNTQTAKAKECPENYRCTHALAIHGEPLYPKSTKHLAWVNPDAPIGGTAKLLAAGTFDSLNPFILKGIAAQNVGKIYDTLTGHSNDEPFSVYGLIAEELWLANDNSNIIFALNKKARFHDGHPIRAEDVIFSFNTLTTKGLPYYRAYYGDVEKVEAIDELHVKFTFKTTENRELPLILGQLPILPKHYYEREDVTFEETTLTPPLGSGPYRIASLDPGKWVRFERVDDYWAKDHFLNKGLNNIGTLHYDYYRDLTVAFEAFKAENLDMREEYIAKNWATGYDIPQVKSGQIITKELPNNNPTGMQAFVFNLRKDKFADRQVRQALGLAFDFEWTNKNIFFDAYTRTKSYFSNSEFASNGLPSDQELELLTPFKDQLPKTVFDQTYLSPEEQKGSIRDRLMEASNLLKESGYIVENGKLVHALTGKTLDVEFLLSSPTYERLVGPFVKNLKRIGVNANIRTVDSAQYIHRLEQFDYDVIIGSFPQSLSPGNEQMEYWHSSRANQSGARNIAGISNEAVDAMVEKITRAKSREELVTATRALDRILLNEHYMIPQYHTRNYRVAYWDKFGMPETQPKYALGFESWWMKD